MTDSSASRGGGIANFATLTMSDRSRVEGNESRNPFDGGGGIFNAIGASATLSFTTVTRNAVSDGGPGGGISNQGTLVVKDASSITSNTAAVPIDSLPVPCTGCCGGSRGGGGIMNDILFDGTANPPHGTLTLIDSTVDGNESDTNGGGITNYGLSTLSGSTISNNTAGCTGGGIDEFALETNPQFGRVAMTNSTLSGDHAKEGGGIRHRTGPASLDYVTITGNSAKFGGGINGDESLTARHTIVAGNVLRSGGQGPDCDGVFTSGGYVLVQYTTFCDLFGDTTGNVLGRDPGLGPLADNGGPSLTHAPGALSSAVDAIPPPCGAATDQRGVVRPQAASVVARRRCDIGAFERERTRLLGFSILDPATAEVTAREPTTYTFTWIVPPEFAGWRAALDALEIRFRDADDTVLWIRFDEPSNTVSLYDDRKGEIGPAFALGSAKRLETPFATLDLAVSALDGPSGPQVTLTLVVTFKPRAAGRAYGVDVRATGDAGEEQGFDTKAQLSVLPNDPLQCHLEVLALEGRAAAAAPFSSARARCRGRSTAGVAR